MQGNVWKAEIARYDDALAAIRKDFLASMEAIIPNSLPMPLPVEPTLAECLNLQAQSFANTAWLCILHTLDDVARGWQAGLIIGTMGKIRYIQEYRGAVLLAIKRLTRVTKLAKIVHSESDENIRSDLREAIDSWYRLTFSSNAELIGPANQIANHKPVNAIQFIKEIERKEPGALSDYAFLCDGAHPGHILNSKLLLSQKANNNFQNPLFLSGFQETMGRVCKIAKKSCAGISEEFSELFTFSENHLVDLRSRIALS